MKLYTDCLKEILYFLHWKELIQLWRLVSRHWATELHQENESFWMHYCQKQGIKIDDKSSSFSKVVENGFGQCHGKKCEFWAQSWQSRRCSSCSKGKMSRAVANTYRIVPQFFLPRLPLLTDREPVHLVVIELLDFMKQDIYYFNFESLVKCLFFYDVFCIKSGHKAMIHDIVERIHPDLLPLKTWQEQRLEQLFPDICYLVDFINKNKVISI